MCANRLRDWLGLAGPLPRPNHPLKVPCGWLGRGSGPARQGKPDGFPAPPSGGRRLPYLAKLPLPLQRMGHYRVQIGEFRHPWQGRLDSGVVGNQRIGIAGPARAKHAANRLVGHPVNRVEHFEHRIAPAITAIHGQRLLGLFQQRFQRQDMGIGQIADMDIVAHPGAVGRVEIGPEHVDLVDCPVRPPGSAPATLK